MEMHPLDLCEHDEHYAHDDDCFWPHQVRVLEDQRSSGSPVVLIGSPKVAEEHAAALAKRNVTATVIQEDRSNPQDQEHKRRYLAVLAADYDIAVEYFTEVLNREPDAWWTGGYWERYAQPPFICGVCFAHPRWTNPCPDCFRL